MKTAAATRTLVAGSLVLGALLTATSLATFPDFSGTKQENLEAIAAAGSGGIISSTTFGIAQGTVRKTVCEGPA